MKKFLTLSFLIMIIASGTIFAEEGSEESPPPKNTITVDVKPAILPLIYVMLIDSSKAFGIAAQYERQISKEVSVAGRYEYSRLGIYDKRDYDEGYKNIMSSISAELHVRFYPSGGIFFLGGTIGYANFTLDTTGESKTTAHYFKYGGKLGWRIDFGKPGGFVLEPGFGYYFVTELNEVEFYSNDFLGIFNFVYDNIAKSLAGAGSQFSLCLGYRF
jgi:hypothetical protein